MKKPKETTISIKDIVEHTIIPIKYGEITSNDINNFEKGDSFLSTTDIYNAVMNATYNEIPEINKRNASIKIYKFIKFMVREIKKRKADYNTISIPTGDWKKIKKYKENTKRNKLGEERVETKNIINSRYNLKSLLGEKYSCYINFLIKKGILAVRSIGTDENGNKVYYKQGEESTNYQLKAKFTNHNLVIIVLHPDRKYIRKEINIKNNPLGYKPEMINAIDNVKIDYIKAINAEFKYNEDELQKLDLNCYNKKQDLYSESNRQQKIIEEELGRFDLTKKHKIARECEKKAKKLDTKHYWNKQKLHNSLIHRINAILDLNSQRYISTSDNVGRFYHSLSNISKVARKFITINGCPFVGIDIVACQPTILIALLKKHKLKIDKEYIKACKYKADDERNIYTRFTKTPILFKEDFYSEEELVYLTRDEVKVLSYRTIFFKFVPNSDFAIKFSEFFPETFKSIAKLQSIYAGQTMASILQKMETELMSNIVVGASIPFYTIHDAVYCTCKKEIKKIREQIKANFKKYKVDVSLDKA